MKRLLPALALVLVSTISCQLKTSRPELKENEQSTSTRVDPKYSLSQDRSEFDKIRQSIPEEKRRANDEKSMVAEWMVDLKRQPSEIRDKFDSLVRKKREIFNSDMTKIRDNYSKTEKKDREDFLKEIEAERTSFSKRKKDRDARNDFYNELDEKRKSYFSELREKRDAFEADVRDQRKNFEDYLKERTLDFNSELKAYTERWNAQNKNQ